MDSILNNIFNCLLLTNSAVECISRELHLQRKKNRNMMIFVAMLATYTAAETIKRKKQEEAIKKLRQELKELKQPEGE